MCSNESSSPGMIFGGGSVVFTRSSQLMSSPESPSQVTPDTNRVNNITGRVTAIFTGHLIRVTQDYLIQCRSYFLFVWVLIYFWLDDTISPLHWSISEPGLATSPLPGCRSSTGVRAGVSVSWVSHWLPVTPGWPAISHRGRQETNNAAQLWNNFGTLATFGHYSYKGQKNLGIAKKILSL